MCRTVRSCHYLSESRFCVIALDKVGGPRYWHLLVVYPALFLYIAEYRTLLKLSFFFHFRASYFWVSLVSGSHASFASFSSVLMCFQVKAAAAEAAAKAA